MKKILKASKYTKKILKSVDQDEFAGTLWVLRHSFAARRVFADYQMLCHDEMRGHGDDSDMVAIAREHVYLGALENISIETIHLHDYAGWVPTRHKFMKLKMALEVPSKLDEWGDEHLYRTILGWWQL